MIGHVGFLQVVLHQEAMSHCAPDIAVVWLYLDNALPMRYRLDEDKSRQANGELDDHSILYHQKCAIDDVTKRSYAVIIITRENARYLPRLVLRGRERWLLSECEPQRKLGYVAQRVDRRSVTHRDRPCVQQGRLIMRHRPQAKVTPNTRASPAMLV